MKLFSCLMMLMLVTPSLASDLKILNIPYGENGPPPCALTCSGVAKHNESHWKWQWESYTTGEAARRVNIAECGFVTPPVVTASLIGPYFGARRCPSISLRFVYKEMFLINTVEEATAIQMVENQCDVLWIATAYNCWVRTEEELQVSVKFLELYIWILPIDVLFVLILSFRSTKSSIPRTWVEAKIKLVRSIKYRRLPELRVIKIQSTMFRYFARIDI